MTTATWLTAQDSEYDEARTPWNVSVQQQPAAVVMAATPDDVVDAVQKARASGLRVAMQGTGHGATARNDLSSTVLVRTRNLNEVTIDAGSQRARVGAGVMWQQVAEAAEPFGLAGLAGSSGAWVSLATHLVVGLVGWHASMGSQQVELSLPR
jgi:FAD/FMN-containing dehydrogenase